MIGRQFLGFALVGVVGFIVDVSVLRLATAVFGLNLYAGRAVSFLAAATVTWALNRKYTFRDSDGGAQATSRTRQWLGFLCTNALGGVINYGTYAWLVGNLALVHAYPSLGVVCGSLAGLGFNFLLTKKFVFRGGGQKQTASVIHSK